MLLACLLLIRELIVLQLLMIWLDPLRIIDYLIIAPLITRTVHCITMIQCIIYKVPDKCFTFAGPGIIPGIFSKDISISEPHQPKETVSMACGLRVTPETALPSC
jgi:hypothetical protein